MKKDTSWGGVAHWYEEHLKGDDTYHAKVIAPNLMRIIDPQESMRVLDLGCGEGYFSRLLHARGVTVEGADIAVELIAAAKKTSPDIAFHVASAESMPFAPMASFDVVICVLALQNMERLDVVMKEIARVVKPGGRVVFVLNHPVFRNPKKTSWGWDEQQKIRYRRIDGYLAQSRASIEMSPGKDLKEVTWSFHRSMQDHMKAFSSAGFAITRLEEWISHKESEKGPKKIAEDTARKEFPLFMCIELTRFK